MMNCSERELLILAYLDGELDLHSTLELESHIASCETCKNLLEGSKWVKEHTGDSALRYDMPIGLQSKVRIALKHGLVETRKQRIPLEDRYYSFRTLMAVGFVAFCAILLSFPIGLYLASRNTQEFAYVSEDHEIENQVVASHVRSLMATHLFDVASTDQHTVKPWFAGKVDFSPPVTDYTAQGFPLIGGRLDYVNNQPVAAVVYRHKKHIINLFVWPDSSAPIPPKLESDQQGYHAVHWIRNGMNLWAVSDMNSKDLMSFAQLINSSN